MRQTYLAAGGALRPGSSPHGQKSGPQAGWGLAVAVRREFFRGETLRRETPALPVEDHVMVGAMKRFVGQCWWPS